MDLSNVRVATTGAGGTIGRAACTRLRVQGAPPAETRGPCVRAPGRKPRVALRPGTGGTREAAAVEGLPR